MNKTVAQMLVEQCVSQILVERVIIVSEDVVIAIIDQLHCDFAKVCTVTPVGSKYRLEIVNWVAPTQEIRLTKLETSLLNAMRENEYNDALESGGCGTWTFTAIDNSGMAGKTASGVISSLVKKGLVIADVVTAKERRNGDEDSICFTELGCKLFDNADGEECQWGGLKLLKELE